jgi:hypothetical protein
MKHTGIIKAFTRVFMVLAILFSVVPTFLSTLNVYAANNTWTNVAGGNWSDHGNWSLGHDPDATENAIMGIPYNAGSTVTVDAAATCLNMDWTGATGTPTLGGTSQLDIYGDMTLIPAMFYTQNTGALLFRGSGNITSNGVSLGSTAYIQFLNTGLRTLQDNLNVGTKDVGSQSTNTLDTNGKTITCNGFYIQGAGGQTLTLGETVVNCTSWTVEPAAIGHFILTANTSTINVSGTGAFAGGNITTYYNINLNGTAHTVSGAFTCVTLRRTGTATKTDTVTYTSGTTVTTTNFAMIGNSATNRLLAQSSTLGTAATITATNQAFENVDFMDITLTTAYDHTANLLTNAGFEDGDPPTGWANGAGTFSRSNTQAHSLTYSAKEVAGSSNAYFNQSLLNPHLVGISLTFSGWVWADVGGKTRISLNDSASTDSSFHTGGSTWEQLSVVRTILTFTSVRSQGEIITAGTETSYWDDFSLLITGTIGNCGGNTGITFTTAAAQTYSAGGTNVWSESGRWTSRVPLPQDDVTCAATVTVDMPRIGKSITFTGTPTVTLSNDVSNYGSLTLASGMTYTTGTNYNYPRGRGAFNITTNGITIRGIRGWSYGGTYTLQDNLTVGDSIQWFSGTLDFNNKNVSALYINTNAAVHGVTDIAKTLILGNGVITITYTADVVPKWAVDANTTITAGNSTIVLTNSGAGANSFGGASKTYNNVTVTGAGAYVLTVTGNNTYNNFYVNANQSAKAITSTGTLQTVNNFTRNAGGTNAITITNGTWAKSDATDIALDYLNVLGSTATPATTWYAGSHSGDGGGNPGWVFNDPPLTVVSNAASGISMDKDGVTASTLNGTIGTLAGSPYISTQFEYGLTPAYGTTTAGVMKYAYGAYSAVLPTTLTPGATYHFRASVTNGSGTYTGADDTFVFTMPSITTSASSAIAMTKDGVTSGNFNGDVTNLGVASNTYAYADYGLAAPAYGSVSSNVTRNAIGGFSIPVPAGLTPGQTYHYRMNIKNGATVVNGTDETFTFTMPTVTTGVVSIAGSHVTLNGNVTNAGVASNSYVFIQYGVTPALGSSTPLVTQAGIGVFSPTINSPTSDIILYYRAAVQNGSVLTYGTITSSPIPAATGAMILKSLLRLLVAATILIAAVRTAGKGVSGIGMMVIVTVGIMAFGIIDALINTLF